jgi:hypothetical protein
LNRQALQTHRLVILTLAGVWVEATQRYLPGWSDARIAMLTEAERWQVERVRGEAFGATATATDPWRLRQAVMIVARHFDHLAQTALRDAVVEAEGEDRLADLMAQDRAPAAGLWDAGWSDDRVGEIVGCAAGQVRELRECVPWICPAARPEAARQRLTARVGAASRAGRLMRLADELDPATEAPYTSEGLLQAMLAIGDFDVRRPGARRRALDWIDNTLAVGRARIDLLTGQERPVDKIAEALGWQAATVRTVLSRFSGREDAAIEGARKEGRPGLLSPKICETLEHADAARFNASSLYESIREQLWPLGGAPDIRTIKGWRATGLRDEAAGNTTLASRFVVALARVRAAAPVKGRRTAGEAAGP